MALFSGKWQKEEKILRVDDGGTIWGINVKGSGFGLDKSHGCTPKVGDTVQLNTLNFAEIRGVKINGEVVFLTSDEQAALDHKRAAEASVRKKKESFEKERESLDAKFAALPKEFQDKIARLRSKNPDFRWEYEPYDMFVCEEAAKFAAALKTPEEVAAFNKLSGEEQKAKIPEMSDDHSGNTFGMSLQLAFLYLTKPNFVKYGHGAMAGLTGCEGYHCHPLSKEEEAELGIKEAE